MDSRYHFPAEIGRPDVTSRFGVAPAEATRGLALFRSIAPENIEFDGQGRGYWIDRNLVALFDYPSRRMPAPTALDFIDVLGKATEPSPHCESPTALNNPTMDVLAPACRPIGCGCRASARHFSMRSGQSERLVFPFALVDTGLRRHLRTFDRKTDEFRYFAGTRIKAPTLLDDQPREREVPEGDIRWTRIIELNLVPYPQPSRTENVELGYGMTDGSIQMRVRAAVAGYILRRWSVDCSPEHGLKEEHYRLWLNAPLALHGVENSKRAPGYRAPTVRT